VSVIFGRSVGIVRSRTKGHGVCFFFFFVSNLWVWLSGSCPYPASWLFLNNVFIDWNLEYQTWHYTGCSSWDVLCSLLSICAFGLFSMVPAINPTMRCVKAVTLHNFLHNTMQYNTIKYQFKSWPEHCLFWLSFCLALPGTYISRLHCPLGKNPMMKLQHQRKFVI
jgi:hypothetical protein